VPFFLSATGCRTASAYRCLALAARMTPLLLLTACTSVQLPPWVTELPRTATAPAPVPYPAPMAAPVPAEPPIQVQASPIASPSVILNQPVEPALPYGAAVASRFKPPSVVYNTPGLQASRTTFTSQAEIHNWLRDQVTALSRSVGVKATLVSIGASQQGQPLEALVLTRGTGGTDAAALLATGRPTVLLVGQQHGDEPAGSEALLVIAQELAQGLLQPLLERINVVIIPRADPDGPNRNEVLAGGKHDMARDHLLLSMPETQALARLMRDYQPMVMMVANEYPLMDAYQQKFAGVQKFDALLQYSTTANLPEFLSRADEEWYRRPLLAALKGQGLSHEWYHTTSADPADRTVSMGDPEPATYRNMGGLKNAVTMAIYTRGAGLGRLDLQRRVHAHVTAITSVLGSTAQRSKELSQLRPYLEKEVGELACKGQALVEVANTPAQYDLQMLDPSTGADKTTTVDWESALALRTVKSRVRPCGYWLSNTSKLAVERLRLHGVKVLQVMEPSAMLGDMYRAAQSPNRVQLLRGVIDAPVGSYYIPLNQPLANLAIAALEPDTRTSYFSNRLVNSLTDAARVMSEPTLKSEELP